MPSICGQLQSACKRVYFTRLTTDLQRCAVAALHPGLWRLLSARKLLSLPPPWWMSPRVIIERRREMADLERSNLCLWYSRTDGQAWHLIPQMSQSHFLPSDAARETFWCAAMLSVWQVICTTNHKTSPIYSVLVRPFPPEMAFKAYFHGLSVIPLKIL